MPGALLMAPAPMAAAPMPSMAMDLPEAVAVTPKPVGRHVRACVQRCGVGLRVR
jgi:hypothetical protein